MCQDKYYTILDLLFNKTKKEYLYILNTDI